MRVDREKIRLVAMDLDGTLTQHKSKLDPLCREVLQRLSEKYRLVMVCAGSCERVYKQMNEFPIDILGFYGMQLSTVEEDKFKLVRSQTAVTDKMLVTEKADCLREELGFTGYYGSTVELHDSGLITFPILGTAANLSEKLAYDPDRSKRRAVYKRVCEVFDGYTVFIGGSSSFDIAPPPYRKLFALETYMRDNGLDNDEIIYFGDDYGLGGNDEDIYNSGLTFITIDDFRSFPVEAERLLLN